MKTLEFKLKLNKSQRLLIDSWLDSMRFIWNEGLGLLLEYHHHKYYQWLSKKLGDNDFRKCHLRFSRKNAFAATCPVGVGENAYPVSSLKVPESRLRSDAYKGLTGYITKSKYSDYQQLKDSKRI